MISRFFFAWTFLNFLAYCESSRKIGFLSTIQELFVYNFPGNHESFPVNMFPDQDDDVPSKYDPSWLYNKLADLYQHWLPDPVQQKTLRDSGYYSV